MQIFKLLLLSTFIPLVLLSNDDRPPIPYDFLAKKEVTKFIGMMIKKHHFKQALAT